MASNQYGGQSISLTHLAPFVDISRKKIRRDTEAEMKELGIDPGEEKLSQIVEARLREEIKRGVQTIQYPVSYTHLPAPLPRPAGLLLCRSRAACRKLSLK